MAKVRVRRNRFAAVATSAALVLTLTASTEFASAGDKPEKRLSVTSDGFSMADINAVSAQYERLVAIGKNFPDVAGVIEFQERDSRISVRVRPGGAATEYRAAIEAARSPHDEVPVVFDETSLTVEQLDSLIEYELWAGQYADEIVQVLANHLHETVAIYATGNFEEIAQKAFEYSSVWPEMIDAEGPDGIFLTASTTPSSITTDLHH